MFGTDLCLHSDVNIKYPNVEFIKDIIISKKLSNDALEKIELKNCARLLNLCV